MIQIEHTECERCDGTGFCPSCLSSGMRTDPFTGEFVECTACDSQNPGGCMYCHSKGSIERVFEIDENEINLDFSDSSDQEYGLDL